MNAREYLSFFGLREHPFRLAPDPAFFFESITHKKAISYLGYGLAQAEGFIVMTGEVGSGKSTLAAHLTQRIDYQRMACGHIVSSALDDTQMLQVAAASFGLSDANATSDKATTLRALEAFLHHQAREGRRALLVVDEAQNLSIGALDELRMLSNYHLGSQPLLQILLLGQPEFRRLLNSARELEPLRQRVIAAHHIGPLLADEVRPYVEHRLSVAGLAEPLRFEPDFAPALHRISAGIPRRINTVMARALQRCAELRQTSLGAGDLGVETDPVVEPQPVSASTARPTERTGPAAQAVAAALSKEDAARSRDALQTSVLALEEQLAATRRELREQRSAIQDRADPPGAGGVQDRLDTLEVRIAGQDALLRRLLVVMIEMVEGEQAPAPAGEAAGTAAPAREP